MRTEVCFNCQLKPVVPGSLGPREPGGGATGVGPMTELATGGQDKLAVSLLRSVLSLEENPARPKKPKACLRS